MSEDKIEEIRARHEDNASIGSIIHGPDRPPSWTLVGWKAHHDRAFLLLELDRLRAENERLFNEDTKTRHALKGWVFVCPDGGDEPTHERVAAVVAEVERLREENERLIRLKKLLDRNEREFLAAIGLATTTVLGPGHDPSLALSSMRLVLAKFEKLRAEIERLRAAARNALNELNCIEKEGGHRCIRCDSEIDEGHHVRLALRNALEGKP